MIMDYLVKDFSFQLPPELIAQKPVKPRDHSRLLLLDKKTGALAHQRFYNFVDYLQAGDVLVLNDSKVFPARLIGQKALSGGQVEIFLHRIIRGSLWECLIGGRVKEGTMVKFGSSLTATAVKDNQDGTWQVEFNKVGIPFWKAVNRLGLMPLPPYIKRPLKTSTDRADYQTVFANPEKIGSVAAPTAGRHFTKRLLKKIESKGVKIIYVTLHVGLGTFAPVKTESVKDHKMHDELAEISASASRVILQAKQAGRRIIAVGTTSARTLESMNVEARGRQTFWTDIFIYPGYQFKVVDALVTNFHLPQSTLIMLVAALAGKANIDKAYKEAVQNNYRFFSYGDVMFIH